MRIVVTGATGLIGSALVTAARAAGDEVVALTRDPRRAQGVLEGVEVHGWADPQQTPPPPEALAGADAVVHLLGEPIAQRWSAAGRSEMYGSRIRSTRNLVAALGALPAAERPGVLVSQSATGYYGACGDDWLDESAPPGCDFISGLVVAWEREALAARAAGVRTAVTRTGVVLAPHGGALARMLPPFRAGVGGPVAGGRQYVPWVHLDDAAGALLHLARTETATGPVNLVAPAPVTNAELSAALGRVLRRPAVVPVPAAALRLLYGEMAVIVTTGQRPCSSRLRWLGYEFAHTDLEDALRDVLERRS